MTVSPSLKKKLLVAFAAAVVAALAWWSWTRFTDSGPGEGFVNGNGRIEATEIDVATTAEYTRQVLAGALPVPPALARQVEHILRLAEQTTKETLP